MNNILLVAVALALDAFGVSLGLGCSNDLNLKERGSIIFSFGFFQFLLALSGALLGNYINNNLFNITNYISGGIILLIGILLLKEGYESEDDLRCKVLNFWVYIVLGISVSIDALGVGFSMLYQLKPSSILTESLIIGIITSLLTLISLIIVKYLKNLALVEKYVDYLGGAILVIFGLKMLI